MEKLQKKEQNYIPHPIKLNLARQVCVFQHVQMYHLSIAVSPFGVKVGSAVSALTPKLFYST